MIEIDIWGNLTHYKVDDTWYRQTFIEDNLLKYEDYQGNYWTPEYGKFALPKIEFDFDDVGNKHNFIAQKHNSLKNTMTFRFGSLRYDFSAMDAGYVYAPYIPINLTPTMYEYNPERRIYNINVGDIDEQDTQAYVDAIARRFRRAPLVDPDTGEMDLRYNHLGLDEDFYLPTRAEPVSDAITAMGLAMLADYKPKKGLMERYSKKVVNNRFYGNIRVTDLIV